MLLLLSIAYVVSKVQPPLDALATSFQNPPASSRPHTWWHWMDGNVTKAGISADLEAMKQAGIGGAHIFDVGQGVPSGPIDYNTPEWRELMVHAIREAKRLSLEMTMHNCAGWSSSGAPWVKPEDAMKKVVFASSEVSFPGNVSIPVPQIVGGYYRDILILAFPSIEKPNPKSLNELTGLGANPGQISKLGWPLIESNRTMIIGPDKIGADGTIDVQHPDGKWTILRIGVTLTGSQNVASRDSGRGLEVDKLSEESLDRFLDGGLNPLLNLVGTGSALTTVLVDSYETGYNNWTPKLLEEFQARRGYDPRPFLPALTGYLIENEKKTLGFLFDYRKTIAELWAQNYSGHFAKRLSERNIGLAIEPYGNGNFDPFSFAKPASLIMGEYWVGDSQINPSVKHASSVAHVYGHNVVGAEALTATPDQAGWRNQPRQWKPFADRAMTLGINRIIYHRFAHQPWTNGVLPGMTMGPWGSHVDRGNTIWPYMPSWNEYVSRCQFILQSGTFVGDVLLFPGEDVPQSYAGEGQDLPQVPQGYDFDFCGVDPLMSLTVKNGRLMLPNGATYAVLALPNTDLMTLPLARKIKELVQLGATVIGPRPTRTPSLSEQSLSAELNEIADSVWGTEPTNNGSHRFGKGQVYWSQPIGTVLNTLGVKPDFWTDAKDVRAIHRRIGEREAYFVASAQPYPKTAVCRFRTSGKPVAVQLWHPESGRIEDAPIWKANSNQSSGSIEIPIQFEGDGSVFVMISSVAKAEPHLTEVRATVAVAKAKVLPRLRIIKAEYGDAVSGKVKDVTKIVGDAAGPHSIRINASNGDMGGDPAVNIVKNLVVTYQLGDATTTVTIRENGTFAVGNIPDVGTPPVFESGVKQISAWQKGEFNLAWSNGRKSTFKVHHLPEPVELKGPWQLKFPGGWGTPPSISLKSLASWTDSTNFSIKHFSGTVAYSKTLPISSAQIAKGKRLILDLGDVRELCRVRLNGKLVATLWKAPFRLDITKSVRNGNNALEIEVTNLWVNRLIGDEQFPDDMGWDGSRLSGWPSWFINQTARPEPRRLTFTTWRHNYKETPLMPSGLLGPVMLRTVRDISVRP